LIFFLGSKKETRRMNEYAIINDYQQSPEDERPHQHEVFTQRQIERGQESVVQQWHLRFINPDTGAGVPSQFRMTADTNAPGTSDEHAIIPHKLEPNFGS
jgi:hypothetical protein